jgi:DNA-binding response OmpR family regulator
MPPQVSSPVALPVRDNAFGAPDLDNGIVLLAVEEPSIGRMLTGVFKRAGMNALWTGSLASTLDWLRVGGADAVQAFVDCPRSEMEIIDFCRIAMSLRAGLRVLLSGGLEARNASAALDGCGSPIYIPKPYLPTELAWQLRSSRGMLRA